MKSTPEQNYLRSEFEKYIGIRHLVVAELKEQMENIFKALDSSPVISGRIKNFESYFSKYIRLLKTGSNPPIINDLLGIRIICPFIEDLEAAEELISKNFIVLEKEAKGHFTFKEFGYESTHFLIKIPDFIIKKFGDPGTKTAELQIRTILQDAWAEVEHELVYKAEFSPFDEPMKRKLAAVNASLSLADIIFQEIRSHQRKYTREMSKRRESFFQKIEESTDELLFAIDTGDDSLQDVQINTAEEKDNNIDINENTADNSSSESIDDLLINALASHNQNNFNKAINQYTRILDLNPDKIICSIIYKHRGMANFACCSYKNAIDDFTNSLNLDNESYKAAYYRGVVHSVLKKYSNAIDDYSLSLKIHPYQPFCLFRRGQAYYHIGDYPQALSDCENSISLEPSNDSAIRFKKLLLEKLKM